MKNIKNQFALALIASCGLALPALAQVTETEPNDTKAGADAVGVINLPAADGPALTGTTTGTSTTVAGLTSADYFRVRTAAMASGIWRNRLVITTDGTAGHTGTIRGLNQSSVGVIGTTDNAAQTSSTTTVPARMNQWYTFGPQAEMYYRVTGGTTTTAPYVVNYEVAPVAPIVVPDTIAAGSVTITETGAIDADYWVYDSSFNPIPGFGIDTSETTGVTRTMTPGTYYLAMARFNGANNLPSAAPETFAGTVLDFPGAWVGGGSTNTTSTAIPVITSSAGSVTLVTSNLANYEVAWYQFTVAAPTVPGVGSVSVTPNTGEEGTTAVVRATVTPAANPISTVVVDASAINGGSVAMNDSGTAPDITAGDGIWAGNVTVGAGAGLGAQTLFVTATDSASLTGTGTTTFTVLPPAPSCPAPVVASASFVNMISTAPLSTAVPPTPQPGDANTNTINAASFGGSLTATAMRITGRYIEVNTADLQTENRIRIVAPSGNAYTATPFPTGADTNPRDLTSFTLNFGTSESLTGTWYFETGESFNDSGEDGHWSTICFGWANPPAGTPVTPITAFNGAALPGFSSDVNFSIAVAGGTGPYSVTVDGSSAGLGTITLTDPDLDGTYTATVPGASFSGLGAFTLPWNVTDSASEFASGNIVVNIRQGVVDLGEVSASNTGLLIDDADVAVGGVRWFRFTTCIDTAAPDYFDLTEVGTGITDTEFGIYRADGTLVSSDDDDGVLAGSAMSFGAGSGLQQGGTGTTDAAPVFANGRDGAVLAAGEYYLAAGQFNVTFGTTNFGATSTGTGSGTVDITFDTNITCGPVCDSIDFNNDGSFFDPQDIDAFLSVFSEGPCIPDTATCNDIDFNNDGSLFDPCDIDSFLVLFSEGPCTLCGV